MFRALMLTQVDRRTHAELVELDESQLPPGDVTVRVEYSSLNFKDALAVTGRGAVVKNWPLVPGIDLAGVVERSSDPAWQPGDRVVVNGWGLGETEWGGLAQKARLSPQCLLRLPAAFTTREAMAIATAGYTAALCVIALQRHGLEPSTDEVLVTGAAGGVGSVAVALLAGLGFRVVASTGRPAEAEYLRFLGAAAILDRSELSSPGKPLQSERWAGVVDTVGSHTLVNACAQTQWHGAVTACGLAQGGDLPGTVMPFILRSVALLGVDSVMAPLALRQQAWARLAKDLDPALLQSMTTEIGLDEAIDAAARLMRGEVRGRIVVRTQG